MLNNWIPLHLFAYGWMNTYINGDPCSASMVWGVQFEEIKFWNENGEINY